MRVLLTIGLVVPAAFMYIELNESIDTKVADARRELIGVEYLRVLEPFATALGAAQSAAIGGGSTAVEATNATLQERIASVAQVDERIGADLGVHERWLNLRRAIEVLPRRGEPRALYTGFHDVMELEVALVGRVAQLSGLSVDAGADTYYLHRAVTDDLPKLTVATGRLADLAALNRAGTLGVPDLASIVELQEDASTAAAHLVESMETAATVTTDSTLVTNVFASLDAVRGDLDRLAAASGAITDGQVSGVDSEVIATLRENLAKAASQLSTSVLDQLDALLTERRDAAGRSSTLAVVAMVFLAVLAVLPTLFGIRNLVRTIRDRRARERLDNAEQIEPGPQWSRGPASAGRERAGAAR